MNKSSSIVNSSTSGKPDTTPFTAVRWPVSPVSGSIYSTLKSALTDVDVDVSPSALVVVDVFVDVVDVSSDASFDVVVSTTSSFFS